MLGIPLNFKLNNSNTCQINHVYEKEGSMKKRVQGHEIVFVCISS